MIYVWETNNHPGNLKNRIFELLYKKWECLYSRYSTVSSVISFEVGVRDCILEQLEEDL